MSFESLFLDEKPPKTMISFLPSASLRRAEGWLQAFCMRLKRFDVGLVSVSPIM